MPQPLTPPAQPAPQAGGPGIPAELAENIGFIKAKLTDIERRLGVSDDGRKTMYERFDRHNAEVGVLRSEIAAIAGRVDVVERAVTEILAAIRRFEDHETRGRFAAGIARVAGTGLWGLIKRRGMILGFAVAAFWREIAEFLGRGPG